MYIYKVFGNGQRNSKLVKVSFPCPWNHGVEGNGIAPGMRTPLPPPKKKVTQVKPKRNDMHIKILDRKSEP